MLRSMNEQLNFRVEATDGHAGSLSDFLLDDRTWTVRYAVIDTGTWLPGRKVLIAREGAGEPDWARHTLPLKTTMAQIEAAPDLSADRPVSRQYEHYLFEHYQWAPYWTPGLTGGTALPIMPKEELARPDTRPEDFETGDPHLRSLRELTGYDVVVGGEKAGRVDAFMYYIDTWEIPFLVADVGGWFHRESLMVPTSRVSDISFVDRQLSLHMKAEDLEELPEYDPLAAESGRLEICTYDYRGRLVSHEPVERHIERN